MNVTMMLVPGKIAKLELRENSTVIAAAEAADTQKPLTSGSWVEFTKTREVRVQNRRYSCNNEVVEGTFGSISTTPLKDGDVVLVLTKIKGNGGDAVITCKVQGEEIALETPVEAQIVLRDVCGFDLDAISDIHINGEPSELSRLVGQNNVVEVFFKTSTATKIFTGIEPAGDLFDQLRKLIAGKDARISELEEQVETLLDELRSNENDNGNTPSVIFGALGGRLTVINFEEGDTVADLDLSLNEAETFLVNGTPFTGDPEDRELVNGDAILVVPTTKTGKRVKFTL